ncbi:hypothetical protein [Thermoplasma acidophilum]|uniref:Glycosyltransferase 2-like domain-containing protein n=2 Tax=Thermoplasma acidophilum TaxID=2303 RepID=Q9HK91_THEAC|nr:hypothetical protein [Thermoplasma acidophilum]
MNPGYRCNYRDLLEEAYICIAFTIDMISVIITAYNRKEYLKEAIRSVIDQNLEKDKYEIILVSNFDFDISDIRVSVKVKKLILEGSMGEFLYHAIMKADGDILTFMDDDDIWLPDKLKVVEETFSDSSIIYYHNNYFYINERTEVIDKKSIYDSRVSIKYSIRLSKVSSSKVIAKALKYRADFNSSCISIRKCVLIDFMPQIRKIMSMPDSFFFWISLMHGGVIYLDNQVLTGYRLHADRISGSKESESLIKELKRRLPTIEMLNNICLTEYSNDKQISMWLNLYIIEYRLAISLLNTQPIMDVISEFIELLKVNIAYTNKLRHRLLMISLLYLINRKMALQLTLFLSNK